MNLRIIFDLMYQHNNNERLTRKTIYSWTLLFMYLLFA